MKAIFTNLALFALLTLVFSGLSACEGTANSENAPVAGQPAQKADPAPPKKSDYPPLVSTVATADLKNLDGTTFKVTDRKGKVLILNMWATWCGPCRKEMPALVRMQETHGGNLEVIGLNTDDESVEEINRFADDMKLNYTLVWADTKTQSELLKISKFGGIPQSFIIDQDGNLRGVFRGAAPPDIRKMEELVAKIVNGEETAAPAVPAVPASSNVAAVDAEPSAVSSDTETKAKK